MFKFLSVHRGISFVLLLSNWYVVVVQGLSATWWATTQSPDLARHCEQDGGGVQRWERWGKLLGGRGCKKTCTKTLKKHYFAQ